MITDKQIGMREKEVVTLLNEHPVLTGSGLQYMLRTKLTKRRLQQILLSLKQKKIVKYLQDTRNGGHGTFYALETHFRKREMNLPYDLAHAEECSLWEKRIQELLPDAYIQNYRAFSKSPEARNALLWDGRDREAVPDLLIFARSTVEPRSIAVAVEIEQTHKSEQRIMAKLARFSRGTNLDGVLYVSPSHSIPERVQGIFEYKVIAKSHRINAYGDHFLLVSGDLKKKSEHFQPLNQKSVPIDFTKWVEFLRHKSVFDRRDKDFADSTWARRAG